MIIAIDGPSGAGKSTVAKAVARELGFSCLDTGAMYRAVAWRALQDGVPFDDDEALGRLARAHDIAFAHEEGEPVPRRVSIGGIDVTDAIRTAEIDRDDQDSSRATSPLRPADDAVRLDSTGRYIEEVIEDICSLALRARERADAAASTSTRSAAAGGSLRTEVRGASASDSSSGTAETVADLMNDQEGSCR